MHVTLTREDQRFIEEQVKAGRFASAEAVVGAALERLRHDDAGEFAAGELDALIAEGEADIAAGELVDGDEVFRRLRQKSADFRERAAPTER